MMRGVGVPAPSMIYEMTRATIDKPVLNGVYPITTLPAEAVATSPVVGYIKVGIRLPNSTCSSLINNQYVVIELINAQATPKHHNPKQAYCQLCHVAPGIRAVSSINVARATDVVER
jgi:hypothetical protein